MRTQRSQHHCCARHTREGTPCRTQHAQHHSSVVTAGSGSALTPVPMHHFMQSSAGIIMLPFVQKTSAPQKCPAFSICHAQVVHFKKSGTLTACLTLHRVLQELPRAGQQAQAGEPGISCHQHWRVRIPSRGGSGGERTGAHAAWQPLVFKQFSHLRVCTRLAAGPLVVKAHR
jgi:hypothetical protein